MIIKSSREWLENYIKSNHLKSIVVGVSGGIDSTVSICLAAPVCKKLNIPLIGRSLPTKTNKNDEVRVANLVGSNAWKRKEELRELSKLI